MALVRYLVQVMVDEDYYSDAAEVIAEIDSLFNDAEDHLEIVSAEIDPDQEMPKSC